MSKERQVEQLLFGCDLVFYLAQEFFGYPKIGGDEVLWYALLHLWILPAEEEIPVLGTHGEISDDAFL